ncbi:MAG: ATP-binding protein [Leptolyngbyaceae cyanobacterium MO_188.B28]|nr:ATP-binding protein [Leptolyngbyaceae cyanobacterium MO_188.B28]
MRAHRWRISKRRTKSIIDHDDLVSLNTPGSIQPHGVLLALSQSDLTILQVSDNTQDYLGIEPQDLLNQPLSTLFSPQQLGTVEQSLSEPFDGVLPLQLAVNTAIGIKPFEGGVHLTDGAVILELEPNDSPDNANGLGFHALGKREIAKMQRASSLTDFLQHMVIEVQKITGFDRVMAYRFGPQGDGAVIAEVKQPEQSSYLGLHYPATDIPKLVRDLYLRCPLRFIPDLTAPPAQLIPVQNPATQHPLNLSLSILRSVDPCCIEYHTNMGVKALLVIPLIQDQQLWGLISAHHSSPKFLPYPVRTTCEFLGQMVSLELANKLVQEEFDYKAKLQSLRAEVMVSVAASDTLKEALIKPEPRLLELVGADGAALCLGGEITLIGATPAIEDIQALMQWADSQVSDSLFCTDSLSKCYPPAAAFKDTASGLLLLKISKVRRYYVLWFRPEVLQTIDWAGDPNDAVQLSPDGRALCPRASFEQWRQTVRLTSHPWKPCEVDSAIDLRNAIVGVVLSKADELAKINLELERSNQELASFAYAASHDLKEPLRGIHNYSTFLLEDYAEILDEGGVDRLNTLIKLSRRMEALIDVLLKFSRLGQAKLNLKSTDLNHVLKRVIDVFRISREEDSLDIRIPRSLPTIDCDPILIGEVFSNLVGNALKYNDSAEKWVEIGYLTSDEQADRGLFSPSQPLSTTTVFYVKDNGIGIRERHLENIFRLFKRLHSQKKYGGGTGAGLTIAKKIVERHDGQIWVESIYGEGTTFYFTLDCPSQT